MIDEPHSGLSCEEENYTVNGTGDNKFWGYRLIPGTVSSPTGTASTLSVPASSSNTTSVVEQAAAMVGMAGMLIAFLFLGLLVIGAGFMFYRGFS